MKKIRPNTLARALRAFFTDHIGPIRGLSPNTLQSYRDAMKLLLAFLAGHHGCHVVDLNFVHLTPQAVLAFLNHLELQRGNSAATRNMRLAAIHSFARFVASGHPEHLEQCQRLLAVPTKRACTRNVEYLEGLEIRAMLDCMDTATTDGRRDRTLLYTLFNTGSRVQELLGLRPADLRLEGLSQVLIRGKGRKERVCPLWPETAELLRQLVKETGLGEDSLERLFRNHRGEPMTRFGVRYLLRKYAQLGSKLAPTLAKRAVHPHTFRHSAAVHMLQAGVDVSSISNWLGHSGLEITNRYARIDLEAKRAAVARAGPIVEEAEALPTWRNDESILTWLESL